MWLFRKDDPTRLSNGRRTVHQLQEHQFHCLSPLANLWRQAEQQSLNASKIQQHCRQLWSSKGWMGVTAPYLHHIVDCARPGPCSRPDRINPPFNMELPLYHIKNSVIQAAVHGLSYHVQCDIPCLSLGGPTAKGPNSIDVPRARMRPYN